MWLFPIWCMYLWNFLTLNTTTSVCIFSIMFSIYFLRCWEGEFCLTIKSFLSWWSFLIFSWLLSVIQGWSCKEKLDASHSWGLKGWNIELRIILYIIYEIEILGYLLLAFDQRSIWDNNVFWFKAQSSGWGEKYFFPLTRCRRNFLGLK